MRFTRRIERAGETGRRRTGAGSPRAVAARGRPRRRARRGRRTYRDEEARRDDPVGVDVVAASGQRRARRCGVIVGAAHRRSPRAEPRTSATSPAIAAAATIAGLIRSVRPVGLPCRPLKLRFDDEAQTCAALEPVRVHREAHRAARAAPLEARVAEDLVEPLLLGGRAHGLRAGHDERLDARRDPCAPSRSRAASRRSERRPFVHEPMKATSICVPVDRLAAREAHVVERLGDCGRASARHVGRRGTRSRTPTAWPGLMPQVTVRLDRPRRRSVTTSSYAASGVGGDRAPPGDRRARTPRPAARTARPSQVLERRLVGVHVADARAALDGHVADGHPLVHRHARRRPRRRTRRRSPTPPFTPSGRMIVEDDVLRVDARARACPSTSMRRTFSGSIARHCDGEHVAHLRGADAERDARRTRRASRCGCRRTRSSSPAA